MIFSQISNKYFFINSFIKINIINMNSQRDVVCYHDIFCLLCETKQTFFFLQCRDDFRTKKNIKNKLFLI